MTISRPQIRSFFASNEQPGANMRRPMLWGYFFKHADAGRLDALRSEMEVDGYRYEDVLQLETGELCLHVSRSEELTADQLFERCAVLEKLASDHDGTELDGFDVGNVDGSVLIPT